MKFTNNNCINELEYQPKSRYVREMLLNNFGLNEDKGIVQVYGVIKGIEYLASVYYKSLEVFEDYNLVFPATVQVLCNVFDSAASVNEMINDKKFNDVLNVCLNEVGQKIISMDEGAEHREASLKINYLLIALIGREGFV